MTFSARSDRRLHPLDLPEQPLRPRRDRRAAARRERTRPPVHLAFVLDRSGSMGGDKIRLAKLAVEESLARLHEDDRFAIVVLRRGHRRRLPVDPGDRRRPPRRARPPR